MQTFSNDVSASAETFSTLIQYTHLCVHREMLIQTWLNDFNVSLFSLMPFDPSIETETVLP